MIVRNEKSMMELVRLPILRLLLLKREILFKGFVQLGGKPCKSFKCSEFSSYHKISRLNNRGLKVSNLTNFIMLFPLSGNHFVPPSIFL